MYHQGKTILKSEIKYILIKPYYRSIGLNKKLLSLINSVTIISVSTHVPMPVHLHVPSPLEENSNPSLSFGLQPENDNSIVKSNVMVMDKLIILFI